VETWKQAAKNLKRDKDLCSSVKKRIDDTLAASKSRSEVLKWIKKPGDPELGLADILEKGPSKRKDREYGQWLLETTEFKGWANGYRRVKSMEETKRALWIRGNYGTGKTTLVSVACFLKDVAADQSTGAT
jgi:hypothetical protein